MKKTATRKPAAKQPAAKKLVATKAAAANKPAAKKKLVATKAAAAPKKPAAKQPAPKKAAPRPRKPAPKQAAREREAVPVAIPAAETSSRRTVTARERMVRTSPVVEILDDPHPISALRRFLDSIKTTATEQQAQIALGAAQLILLPYAREGRGSDHVKEVVDMVLERWSDFPAEGFHAQELLRNAFAAIGVDRERIAKLEALVPPGAGAELLFNLACAHAVARDKVAMLRAVDRALEAGASASQFRRDPDFAAYATDPDLAALLASSEVPPIPVDIEPFLDRVRDALDELVGTLRELGERVELRPPVRLDAILDAERARKISLPNDYRALLSITNGMKVWDYEFFGVGDYRDPTPLAVRAQRYLQGAPHGAVECIPLASCGQPNDWLLYDPRGRVRGDGPGYVVVLETGVAPQDDLVSALGWIQSAAVDMLGTN